MAAIRAVVNRWRVETVSVGVNNFIAEGTYMGAANQGPQLATGTAFTVSVPVTSPITQLLNDLITAIIADAATKGITLTGQEILHPSFAVN